jgi:hypothetical protein
LTAVNTPANRTPVPDPTVLTTAALGREINGLREILTARLDAMDKARDLFNQNHLLVVESVRGQIEAVANRIYETFRLGDALRDEKFSGVALQFRERDARTETTARDQSVAVNAALQAAEKAVGKQNESFTLSINKSEAATTKQIDQQSALLATATDGLRSQIQDLKERLDRQGGESQGARDQTASGRASSSNVVGITGLVVGVILGLAGLALTLRTQAVNQTAAPSQSTPQIIYLPSPPPATK